MRQIYAGNICATEDLSRAFPESSYALTQQAIRCYDSDRVEEAVDAFKKIRRIDRYASEVSYMV